VGAKKGTKKFFNRLGGFWSTPRPPFRTHVERMRLLASLSNTTTNGGWTRHDECRTSLYAPGDWVLFTFLDISFREDPFSAAHE
jgi:hypothetical protein